MDIQKCVFCGRTVAPELPHYVVNGIQICLRCGGYKTLSNLAATGAGFSVVMEEPIEVGLPRQTYPPHIEVENVDGELVEKEPESMEYSRYTVEEAQEAVEKPRKENQELRDSAFKAAGVTPEETGTVIPPNGVLHNCELSLARSASTTTGN